MVRRILQMTTDTKAPSERMYFPFLDGIRGLSALYVLLFHVIADGNETLTRENLLLNFFRFGHEAVVVFIVLSGFVLTVPLVRSSQLKLKGGLKLFLARRAKRILPGYYAALLLLPLYTSLVELSKGLGGEGTDWQRIKSLFFSGDLLSHLFLVHNVSRAWEGSINPVLWSMGTEWWIYFIFALVLIPLWRRFGIVFAFMSTLLLGIVPIILLILGLPTLYGFPYLIAAFGVGMTSVAIMYSEHYKSHAHAWRIGLNIVIISSVVLFLLIAIFTPSLRLDLRSRFVEDFLLAIACGGSIIKLSSVGISSSTNSGVTWNLKKLLELKPIRLLGKFSYSLYLTHLVVLNIMGTTLNLSPIKARIQFSLQPMPIRVFVVMPLLLAFAYGFYRVFEKPFIRAK
jgi:peptidoglycan/LPS O-acetylase OafA/YrhL